MSAQPNDGGPAFPYVSTYTNEHGLVFPDVQPGLTLRDWFAGQALEEDISNHQVWVPPESGGPFVPDCSREEAKYRYADAMIAARGQA